MRTLAFPLLVVALVGCGGGEEDMPPPPDAGPPPLFDAAWQPYPSGPYGVTEYSIVTNLQFSGYVDDNKNGNPFDDTEREWSLEEYFQGSRDPGAKVIFINAAAPWCGPCGLEASE